MRHSPEERLARVEAQVASLEAVLNSGFRELHEDLAQLADRIDERTRPNTQIAALILTATIFILTCVGAFGTLLDRKITERMDLITTRVERLED
jgi:hypothetical protein